MTIIAKYLFSHYIFILIASNSKPQDPYSFDILQAVYLEYVSAGSL
jgi:hypothetical protein